MSKTIGLSDQTKQASAANGRPGSEDADLPAPKDLPPAALRALQEAEERRQAAKAGADAGSPSAREKAGTREINGRGGLDPVRYGDWEIKGIISDF